MSVVLDANVLVHAHRLDSAMHDAATESLQRYVDLDESIGVPWSSAYEFLRVVTHPKVFAKPATSAAACRFVRDLLATPPFVALSETERHVDVLRRVLEQSGAVGSVVHDAHVVALAIEHGFEEILTEDRDFRRFEGIRVVRLSH